MNGVAKERRGDEESIEAIAAAWLAQRDEGLAPGEAEAFAAWRAADPRHEAAVARLEAVWTALQDLRDFRPEAVRHPDYDLLAPRRERAARRPNRVAGWALGFGAAAAVVFAVFWVTWPRGPAATVFATTVDGYERVALPDGSLVELNGDSEVRVAFAPELRRVRLVRGEAHFTVARDPARPFVTEAGEVAVRALGTAFNVRLGAGAVEVLVTEGKVRVAERSAPAEAAGGTVVAVNERVVVARQPAQPPQVPAGAERVTAETVRATLAWQGPPLVFADTPLAEAIAHFNRRNPVQITLADEALGSLPIGGSFRPENVEGFLRLLVATGDVAIERPDAGRVVLRAGTAKPDGSR